MHVWCTVASVVLGDPQLQLAAKDAGCPCMLCFLLKPLDFVQLSTRRMLSKRVSTWNLYSLAREDWVFSLCCFCVCSKGPRHSSLKVRTRSRFRVMFLSSASATFLAPWVKCTLKSFFSTASGKVTSRSKQNCLIEAIRLQALAKQRRGWHPWSETRFLVLFWRWVGVCVNAVGCKHPASPKLVRPLGRRVGWVQAS